MPSIFRLNRPPAGMLTGMVTLVGVVKIMSIDLGSTDIMIKIISAESRIAGLY